MLKFYLGVFLGLSQVSGECNYRFVCNTGLVHPAGSILDKTKWENGGGAGEGKAVFIVPHSQHILVKILRNRLVPKAGVTQAWCH